MNNNGNRAEKIRLSVPEDCGNAPKKAVLRDFHMALAEGAKELLSDMVSDHVTWRIIGGEVLEGKEAFLRKAAELNEDKTKELEIYNIITHGYTAAANGKRVGAKRIYEFCFVYRFSSAAKNAKIKEITSYIIDERTVSR